MRLGACATLLVYGATGLLPAAMAAPFTRETHKERSWSQLILGIGRALGMRGYKHGSTFAVDLGMPQTGDNWLWNLNGWTLAESELSVVVSQSCLSYMKTLSEVHFVGSRADPDVYHTPCTIWHTYCYFSWSSGPPPPTQFLYRSRQ